MYQLGPEQLLIDANPHTTPADKGRGLVPRDYLAYPVGSYPGIAAYHAVNMPTFSQSEWSARLAEQTAQGARLSDIRRRGANGKPIPSRDQAQRGYCWAHSGVSAHLLIRAVMGLPYADLSAYAVACIIKRYADEGGWGAQGVDFERDRGVPTSEFWPQQSVNPANDNPRTWENAALHKITEGWIDLAAAQYDRNLTFAQVATCLLLCQPCVTDYNWWSHSVCGADLVDGSKAFATARGESGKLLEVAEFESVWNMADAATGGFGLRIWNSWGDGWSDQGMGVLPPQKAVPDGCVALRAVTASDN
jgi:hypothetical protein